MMRTGADTGLAREFKNVFELGGVPAFNQYYEFGIFIWKWLYRGFYKLWHLIPAPTIADPKNKRLLYRMNMSKAICAEMASLVWGEECTINVSQEGFEETEENPDPLNLFVQKVLGENAMHEKMQESVEQTLALGGAAMKVYSDIRRDDEGNEIPETRRINIGHGRHANITLALRSAGDDYRPLNADKRPQRDQHSGLHLRHNAAQFRGVFAPEIQCEIVPMEAEQHHKDKEKDRHQFADRAGNVQKRSLLHAPQYSPVHQPDHRRPTDNGPQIVPAGKHAGEEVIERIHQQNGIRHITENVAEPIRPRHLEPRKFPESDPGISIDPCGGIRTRI